MLPRLDPAALPTPPAGGSAPASGADGAAAIPGGDARQQALQRFLADMIGQTLPGSVLSTAADGSTLVKIADNLVRLMLPPGLTPGSDVALTVVAASPRPTFQIGNGNAGGALVYSAAPEAATPASTPTYGALASQNAPLPGAIAQSATPGAPAQQGAAGAPLPGALPNAAPAGTGASAAAGAGLSYASLAELLASVDVPVASSAAATAPGAAGTSAAAPLNPAAAALAGTLVAGAKADGAALAAALTAGLTQATTAPPPSAAALVALAQKLPTLAAALLGRAPLTPADQLPELNDGTPGAALSSAGRALTILLSAAQSLPGTPMTLVGKAPLVADGAPEPEQLAKTLRATVSESGLFYESHVTDWAKGERPLPDLLREPQMQRMMEEATAPPRPANAGPDLGAAQLVNLQLHTQEQARVQWTGQAWPGQQMQWDIRREQCQGRDGGEAGGGEPEAVWRSGVRFRFPLLGQISAAVTIVGEQVHVQVLADSDDTVATLRAYAGELETAMAAAGAPLSSLAIAADQDAAAASGTSSSSSTSSTSSTSGTPAASALPFIFPTLADHADTHHPVPADPAGG